MAVTPYEMRFNYYMAAKDQLTSEYHALYADAVRRMESKETGLVFPGYPSAVKIFALAEEIKSFAEKK